MPARRLFAALVVVASLLAAPVALAAEPESAQALYDRGLAAFKAGHFEEACPALEQSYKLEPLPGALFTLAECELKRGRNAVAAARYDEYLRVYAALPPDKQAKQGEREKVARTQRAALALKVAELTLALPASAPPGTRVTRDGQPVLAASLGVPALVDPGEHVIRIQVPGAPDREMRVTVAPGEKKGLALEAGQPTASSVPAASAAPAAAPEAPAKGPNRTVIIAGGAIAGASAVAGAIFAGLWASKGSSAKTLNSQVPTTSPCTPDGTGTQPNATCTSLVSALNAKAAFGSAAVGLFSGASAVGLATLLYGLAGGRSARTGVTVSPVVTAGIGGVLAGGSF